MKKLLEEQLYKGTGTEFFVNSVLSSVFSSCKLEIKLENNSEASVVYAQLPNSLLGRVKISDANHMLAPKAGEYFLIAVIDGFIDYEIDGNKLLASPGDIVIINEGQRVERWTREEGMEFLILKILPANFHRMMRTYMEEKLPADLGFHNYLSGDNPKAKYLRRCLENAFDELLLLSEEIKSNYHDEVYYQALLNNLESYLLRSVLLTLRKNMPLAEVLDNTERAPLPRYLVEAVKYINTHIHDPLHIKDFAQVLGVSQRSLNAAFQSHIGVPPKQYIKAQRLDGVHDELKQLGKDASVTDVATKWGFTQLGWFSAEYKKRFGESPSETVRCVRPETE